jgi:hypothetical protein
MSSSHENENELQCQSHYLSVDIDLVEFPNTLSKIVEGKQAYVAGIPDARKSCGYMPLWPRLECLSVHKTISGSTTTITKQHPDWCIGNICASQSGSHVRGVRFPDPENGSLKTT